MQKHRNRALRSLMYRLLNALFFLLFAVILITVTAQDAERDIPIIAEANAEQPKAIVTDLVYHIPETAPTVPETTPVETDPPVVSRYAAIELTEDEIDLLAQIVWLEARGECFEGQQAVVEVVLNRMLSDYFPDTLEEVIFQKNQFSTAGLVHKAEPGNTQYLAIEAAFSGANILPLDVVFFSQAPQNDNIWGSIGGHVFCYPWFWTGNE